MQKRLKLDRMAKVKLDAYYRHLDNIVILRGNIFTERAGKRTEGEQRKATRNDPKPENAGRRRYGLQASHGADDRQDRTVVEVPAPLNTSYLPMG